MRRRTLILAATGGSVLGAAALGILIGPRLVEHEIEARLRARLEDRGIHATWSDFVAHGVRSFEVDDLHVEVPQFGAVLDSERVIVEVGFGSIWSGDIRLNEVSLSPARLEVDVEKLIADEGAEGHDAGAAANAAPAGSALLRRILENPPVVHLTDAQLLVTRGDDELMRIASPEVAVEESWGDFSVTFEGDVEVLADEVPAPLRKKLPWRFEGSMTPDEGSFEYRIVAPQEGTPLVRVDLPETLSVEIARVSGEGRLSDRTAAIELEGLELVVGQDEHAAVHARAPRALVSRQRSGRPRIELLDPSVYVTPSKRGQVRDVLRDLRTDDEGDPDSAPAKPRRARRERSFFSRITRLAARTDVELTGLSVGLHLEREDGSFNTITLLERLDTSIRSGLIRATGSTAGGKFFAEAEVYPGQSWPHYLVVRADGVHVEKIPGMARERSQLPSRGTSGTVAGVVDLDLVLTMPSGGMNGPLLQDPGIGEARFRWTGGVLDLTGVAEVPLTGIDTTADVAFRMRPELAWVELEKGRATYGPVSVNFTGRITDFPLDTELELEGAAEEVECQTMFRSLPTGLLGPYANVELEGKWAPRGWLRFPLHRPLGMRLKIEEDSFADLCRVSALNTAQEGWAEADFVPVAPTGTHRSATRLLPPITLPGPDGKRPRDPQPRPPKRSTTLEGVEWLNSPFVKRITEGLSDLEAVEIYVGPGTADYVPLDELPPWVGGAAFLSEQMDFYEDGPISLSLMKKAMRLNLQKRRFVYGGSTVTQQLVKNLFLTRQKTLARKLQEALIAWRIDDAVSKDRVLELYLNCIEFGKDVYGIGPAARHYFNKDARYLTPKEAVFLAMLKPAPLFGERIMERGTTPKGTYWTERIVELHQRLVDYKLITPAQMKSQEPFVLEWDEDGRYKSAPMLFGRP